MRCHADHISCEPAAEAADAFWWWLNGTVSISLAERCSSAAYAAKTGSASAGNHHRDLYAALHLLVNPGGALLADRWAMAGYGPYFSGRFVAAVLHRLRSTPCTSSYIPVQPDLRVIRAFLINARLPRRALPGDLAWSLPDGTSGVRDSAAGSA